MFNFNPAKPATSLGGNLFGGTTTNSQSATAPLPSTLFGSNAQTPANQPTNAFGTQPTNAFGTQPAWTQPAQPTLTQATQPTIPSTQPTTLLSGNLFGATTSQTAAAPSSSNLFGTAAKTQAFQPTIPSTQPATFLGGNLFGGTTTTSQSAAAPFSSNLFGTAAKTQAVQPTNAFGTQSTLTQATQPTLTQPAQPTSAFGNQPATTQSATFLGGNLFGATTSQSTGAPLSSNLFGTAAKTQATQPTLTQATQPTLTQATQPTLTQAFQPTLTQVVQPTIPSTQPVQPTIPSTQPATTQPATLLSGNLVGATTLQSPGAPVTSNLFGTPAKTQAAQPTLTRAVQPTPAQTQPITTQPASTLLAPQTSVAAQMPAVAPIQDKMTFRELDTMLNKLIDDFEQQQHTFKRQVDEVNAYDLVLADNEEKLEQFNRELNLLEEEKDRFGMDVQMISEMQGEMLKVIEDMEKQAGIPAYGEGEQDLKQKYPHSVDERRFSMLQLLSDANAQYDEIEDSLQEASENLTALRQSQQLVSTNENESSSSVMDQIRLILHKQLENVSLADKDIGKYLCLITVNSFS